jgi:hypothetical protein
MRGVGYVPGPLAGDAAPGSRGTTPLNKRCDASLCRRFGRRMHPQIGITCSCGMDQGYISWAPDIIICCAAPMQAALINIGLTPIVAA